MGYVVFLSSCKYVLLYLVFIEYVYVVRLKRWCCSLRMELNFFVVVWWIGLMFLCRIKWICIWSWFWNFCVRWGCLLLISSFKIIFCVFGGSILVFVWFGKNYWFVMMLYVFLISVFVWLKENLVIFVENVRLFVYCV